jgi:hypothetical protein
MLLNTGSQNNGNKHGDYFYELRALLHHSLQGKNWTKGKLRHDKENESNG